MIECFSIFFLAFFWIYCYFLDRQVTKIEKGMIEALRKLDVISEQLEIEEAYEPDEEDSDAPRQ